MPLADAALAPPEAPSRTINEIADRLDSDTPLTTGQLFKLVGVLTTCAHYAVTFSQRLGRDCYLPGFLHDPRYVGTDHIRADQRLFPHALNAVQLENDLPTEALKNWGPTPYHGWQAVLEQCRARCMAQGAWVPAVVVGGLETRLSGQLWLYLPQLQIPLH